VVTLGMGSSTNEKKAEEFTETLLANQSLLFLLVLANHCTSQLALKNPYRQALFQFTNSQGKDLSQFGLTLRVKTYHSLV